jgi:hypothetical protein
MTVHLTLLSGNDLVLSLVGDFARGLGGTVDPVPEPAGPGIRIEVPDVGYSLVDLLSHVALSATKAGVDVQEPLCMVTFRHEGAASAVTLTLRIADVSIDPVAPSRA